MIKVEHLSKQYRIGVERTYKTFQDAITSAVKSPLKLLNRKNNGNHTFQALKDVSFEIEEGEVVGIIGSNGAGKSTLLKILSRINEPTEGRIIMYGRVASLLEVGTGFHPELTGRDNTYLSGSILGMKKHYSSGMYVRLGFAVSAHQQSPCRLPIIGTKNQKIIKSLP
jgi:lipopolysaccharide transport system ATP-binding protein